MEIHHHRRHLHHTAEQPKDSFQISTSSREFFHPCCLLICSRSEPFKRREISLVCKRCDIPSKDEDLWCTRCNADVHTKDTCPYFKNYLLSGAPNPLICGSVPWCRIFQVYGHRHEECGYMQNLVTNLTNLYCSFCRSVRHEDKDCCAYDLL